MGRKKKVLEESLLISGILKSVSKHVQTKASQAIVLEGTVDPGMNYPQRQHLKDVCLVLHPRNCPLSHSQFASSQKAAEGQHITQAAAMLSSNCSVPTPSVPKVDSPVSWTVPTHHFQCQLHLRFSPSVVTRAWPGAPLVLMRSVPLNGDKTKMSLPPTAGPPSVLLPLFHSWPRSLKNPVFP